MFDLSQLTPQQREAVLHRASPLLIIAGPGSGKTEVLTWRVAHLVASGQVAPEHCLVTTFTQKAALELKDRIQQKLPDVDVEQMPVATIHSLCAQILRDYQTRSPMPRGFRVLDEDAQLLLVYRHRRDVGLDGLMKGRPHDFFSGVLRMFNLTTEELVQPERLHDWCMTQRETAEAHAAEAAKGRSKAKAQKAADAAELWKEEAIVTEAYRAYCDLLRARGLVDFAFLQRHSLDLLDGHPDVVAALRERFQEILVDEYQDTNAAQERVLRHLAGDGQRLTVVGDDDQSIYRFRGATVGNLLTFEERYPGTSKIYLNQNFRSRDPIVEGSQTVITHNPARFSKKLFTTRGQGSDIVLIYERSVAEEATSIARLLLGLHRTGKIRRWGDVAVLLRSVRSFSSDYTQALSAEGIPAFVVGDATFFERDDIAQLCKLFHFLGASKPWGDLHLRCPLVGLSEAACEALKAYKENLLDANDDGALRAIGVESEADRKTILALLALKRRAQAKEHESLLSVFYDLLDITGCAKARERAGDVAALMNLGAMSRLIARFDEYGGTRNLYPFQDYLQLLAAGGAEAASVPPADAVQVMTIHQAKGLEFPVVVLGSVMDGRLPSTRRRDRYDVPHDLRASGPPEVADPHLVDERRLFYVGATRAKELLILGTADVVQKRGGGPSPFLVEMLGEDLHAAANLSRARIEEVKSAEAAQAHPRERLSFSQLAYFLQCPVRYKLAVVCGLETSRPDPVDFGANVHRALLALHERALAGGVLDDADVEALVELSWLPAPSAAPAEEHGAKQAAVRQLQRYVREHAAGLGRVERAEVPFSFRLAGSSLLGRIDLIRQDDGGAEIVDFKTSKSTETRAEQEQVELQLDIYALGVETAHHQRVARQTVHFLGSGAVNSWAWNAPKASRTRARLSDLLEQIATREFAPRQEFCPRCDFRRICPHAAR